MDTVLVGIFWTSAALIVYGYLGYPLLVYAVGRFVHPRRVPLARLPRVSLLVPVYNEAHTMRSKIANVRRSIPSGAAGGHRRLRLVDGCSAEIIQRAADAAW